MIDIGKIYKARSDLFYALGGSVNVLVDQIDGEWVLKVFGDVELDEFQGWPVVAVQSAALKWSTVNDKTVVEE